MKYLSFLILSVLLFPAEPQLELNSFHDLSAVSIDGKNIPMADYKGKKILVVNVASKCGYTPQYEGLQKLFEIYEKEYITNLIENKNKKNPTIASKSISVNFSIIFL